MQVVLVGSFRKVRETQSRELLRLPQVLEPPFAPYQEQPVPRGKDRPREADAAALSPALERDHVGLETSCEIEAPDGTSGQSRVGSDLRLRDCDRAHDAPRRRLALLPSAQVAPGFQILQRFARALDDEDIATLERERGLGRPDEMPVAPHRQQVDLECQPQAHLDQ